MGAYEYHWPCFLHVCVCADISEGASEGSVCVQYQVSPQEHMGAQARVQANIN